MKAFANIFTLSALAVCLTACNDDIGTGSNVPAEESEGIYLKFALDLPSGSGSRSKTDTEENEDYGSSSDGTEVGKDHENRINQIMLVFTDKDNNYLTSTNVTSVSPTTSTINEYIISIPPERLADYVSPEPEQGEEAEQRIAYVYAYCNPTDELRALAGAAEGSTEVTNFIQKAHTITDSENASVWQDNNFLMSNAVKHEITLPESWNENLSSGNPYDLTPTGPIKVERSVARFDYKAVHDDNKYVVRDNLKSQEEVSEKNPGIYIQLTDVALINMSKSFYYLRRVSKNGQNTEATICGVETANNYVVDTDAADKLKYTTASNWPNKRDNFFYNLEESNTWKWTSLADISDNEEDNAIDPVDKEGYHIWRYAIENTIPQDASETNTLQKNGITTGVVFRAKIGREDNSDVTWTDGNDIYVFDDVLYGDWNAVREYAKEHPNEDVAYAYEAVESGDYEPEKAGFTIYTQNEDGNYYAYYYYWNRHNDNRSEPDMGPMEFAVVRNNVYKLSVEAIYRFGYPEGETPDPETPDEEDPKEDPGPDPEPDPEVFLKVNVQVLPWVVRENEISFGDKDTGTN